MSDDPLSFRVLNEIGIIDQLASAVFTAVLPRNISIAQFSVLNHFVRLEIESQSPAELASAFQVSRPTMTNILARLERSELVSITPDPDDGRAKRVAITNIGRAMRQECLARLEEPRAALEAKIPTELFEKLAPLLAELRSTMDTMRD